MISEVQQARASAGGPPADHIRLEELAAVLSRHGLRASLTAPREGIACLHVVNPAATVLAEDVYSGRG